MQFYDLALVCPACHGEVQRISDEALRCERCNRVYPVLLGIPDFRLWPDPYIGIEEDRAKGLRLAAECANMDFAGAVRHYYEITEAVPPFQAQRFTRSLLAAAGRAESALTAWDAQWSAGARLLDIGCGTAPLLQAAASRYERAAGVDIAFRWLIMARKRLDDAGLDVPLICACAEALPFPAASFDRVVADSTLEHLRDQRLALDECCRALRPGGRLFVTTPNRRSLGPDPHIGLPAGGWLPDSVIEAYVRRKGGIPPRRRLLSARELGDLLERAELEVERIGVPEVPAAQRAGFGSAARLAIDAYHLVKRLPLGGHLLLQFGPLLEAVARKPAGGDAGPVAEDHA